jgi:ABC-type bacteriocin/lantibiotic exporter with double-glycine peptidase domain
LKWTRIEKNLMKDLEIICEKSMCLAFINDKILFPEGFDTIVGEKGIKLSGGQN